MVDRSNAPVALPDVSLSKDKRASRGLVYGLGAYTIWGLIPIYFKAVAQVPSRVVLCHRIVWSALFVGLLVTLRGEWHEILGALRVRRNRVWLPIAALLIAANWLTFIYSVATRQLLQASLGYFINPILSIALGVVFLGEKLRGWQWLAVLIATLAVGNLALHSEGFPWISMALAGSFGFYGLVRKKLNLNALHSLFIESIVLVPIALVALSVMPASSTPPKTFGLLSLSGVITAVPLLLFGAAVRRLPLSTMGFLQYLGPTLQFLVAISLFREPLEAAKFHSFMICWVAIGVYVADSISRKVPQPISDEPD